jgi:hypothetical protein
MYHPTSGVTAVSEQRSVRDLASQAYWQMRSLEVPEGARHPGRFLKQQLMSDVFKISCSIYKNARVSLEYCEDVRLAAAARRGLQHNAVITAQRIRKAQVVEGVASAITFLVSSAWWLLFAAQLAHYEHMSSSLLKAGLGAFLALIVNGQVSDLVQSWSRQRIAKAVVALIGLGVAALISGTASHNPWYSITHHVRSGTNGTIAYVLIVGSVTLLLLVVGDIVSSVAFFSQVRDDNHKYVTVELIDFLVVALGRLSERPALIRDLTFKADVARDIELAASYLQNRIPKSLLLADASARSEFQSKCTSSALALRAIQVKIAVSGEDSLDDVKRTISTFIIGIASGNYAILPDGNDSARKEHKIEPINVAKGLVGAFSPMALLIATRHIGLALSKGASNWAIAIVLLWAAISIASMIDPLYRAKIMEVQSLISTFRRSK